VNVDPLDSGSTTHGTRASGQVFEQGLTRVIGNVLPVARSADGTRWQTGAWFLRSERCFLIPGDSPIGYRLRSTRSPGRARRLPYIHAPDPSRPSRTAAACADSPAISSRCADGAAATQPRQPSRAASTRGSAGSGSAPRWRNSRPRKSAVPPCAPSRANGVLYIFMPPTRELEHYVELVAAVEAAAEALQQPVVLEGYEPPAIHASATSSDADPGVIEVNIHPSANWRQLADRTSFCTTRARECRLTTEKFMLDAATSAPAEAITSCSAAQRPRTRPFCRPDLLRSLLSYCTIIRRCRICSPGCSSDPPRRRRAWMRRAMIPCTSWKSRFGNFPNRAERAAMVVDRLLRNLLIDVTGNTHRTEFCIDKLFRPTDPPAIGIAGNARVRNAAARAH